MNIDLLDNVFVAAFTTALIAGLRSKLPNLTAGQSMLLAGVVALIVTAAYQLATVRFIDWESLPLGFIVTWAMAMGFWSGGKAALGKS